MRVKDLRIVFKYEDKRKTTCSILDENNQVLSQGHAECGRKDHFCKDTGRKYSMKRALEPFSRETRSKIWETYRHATKNPRW